MIKLLLSPDTLVHFENGKILVHAGGNGTVLSNPFQLMMLLEYQTPKEFDEQREPADSSEKHSHETIRRLHKAGVLIEVQARTNEEKEAESRRAANGIQNQLRELAGLLYRLSGELSAMGSYSHLQRANPNHPSPADRLQQSLLSLGSLYAELKQLRRPFVDDQLQGLGLGSQSRGLKLHIGSGPTPLDGWVNMDIAGADLSVNASWGLPFGDGSADYVFLSHMLEHLYYPVEARSLLADIHRVLAPAGVVRIIVPDIEKCLRAYCEDDSLFFESRRHTWDWWPVSATRLEDFLHYAGAGPRPSHFFDAHKFGYDFETLAHLLGTAGFDRVTRSEYMASEHPELRVDAASRVAGAKYGERYYSLFVEAVK